MRSEDAADVVVLGAGVIGLCTAIRLAESGFRVQVVAERFLRATTSSVATAMWHVFLVGSDPRVEGWSIATLAELLRLAAKSTSGVSAVGGIECIRGAIGETSSWTAAQARPTWSALIDDYKYLSREDLIAALPSDYPSDTIVGGFAATIPVIDMTAYLPYLMARLAGLGVAHTEMAVRKLQELRRTVPAEYYVNCTGYGARALVPDPSVRGIKGQLVRMTRGTVTEYFADDDSPLGMTYVFPRAGDLVVGGSADMDVDNVDLDHDESQRIFERGQRLVPSISDNKVLEELVGVRPYRPSVRVESDPSLKGFIHNYGHGGSGVSLSWGCADEVVRIIQSNM